jgi:hypothetical protein
VIDAERAALAQPTEEDAWKAFLHGWLDEGRPIAESRAAFRQWWDAPEEHSCDCPMHKRAGFCTHTGYARR